MARSSLRRAASKLALIGALVGCGSLTLLPVGVAWAQHDAHGHDPVPGKTNPTPAHGADHADHGADHGGGHHGPGAINWFHGLIAEKDGITEPDLFFRPKGMPAPFLANIINFGVVAFILVSKAGPMVRQGLIDRRESLLRDSDAAAKAKAEAQERFREQQGRLDRIEEEVARIKADYIEQGKRELERIEREAKERHERLLREASLLVEQESRALRQRLLNETIEAAARSAEEVLSRQVNAGDQERLANEFLAQLGPMQMKRGEA